MKLIILVVCAFVAVAFAAPSEEPIPIVRSANEAKPDGGYEFSYETGNGIVREETGAIKDALDEDNKPHQVVVVRGSYTYTDPEGKVETINYIADENGYQAQGDSIPQVPARR